MVRRERRRKQALGWNVVTATFTRFTTWNGSPTLPHVDYTYEVNGEAHGGWATGLPIKDDRINQIGDAVDLLPALRVRYDPVNPDRSQILNEDNSRIPFEIDLLAHWAAILRELPAIWKFRGAGSKCPHCDDSTRVGFADSAGAVHWPDGFDYFVLVEFR